MTSRITFREWPAPWRDRFAARGHAAAEVFAHRLYCVPKAVSDHLAAAREIDTSLGPEDLWLATLHAVDPPPARSGGDGPAAGVRHDLGRPGYVGHTRLVRHDARLYCLDLASALPAGSQRLLLNAVLDLALGWSIEALRVPASAAPAAGLYQPREVAGWLSIDVAANRDRIVRGESHGAPAFHDPGGQGMEGLIHVLAAGESDIGTLGICAFHDSNRRAARKQRLQVLR